MLNGIIAIIAQVHLNQHISYAHDTKPNLPPIAYTITLFLKWMQRQSLIQHVIQCADGDMHGIIKQVPLKVSVIINKFGKIDRAEEATSSCWQRFFGTWIYPCIFKIRVIFQHIILANSIPEQDAWFSPVPVVQAQFVENITRLSRLSDCFASFFTRKRHNPIIVIFNCSHEIICHTHRDISLGHAIRFGFDVNKIKQIGMMTVKANHQCSHLWTIS